MKMHSVTDQRTDGQTNRQSDLKSRVHVTKKSPFDVQNYTDSP